MQLESFLLFIGVLTLFTGLAEAQFGVPKPNPTKAETEASAGENDKAGFLSEKEAADMEALIIEAKRDVETMSMITRLKSSNSKEIEALRKLSQEEILGGMKEALDNIKLMDVLFKDQRRALEEMEKDGMIEKSHVKKYRKDPTLLEQDMRKGLYFQFVSLAMVGGFLDD